MQCKGFFRTSLMMWILYGLRAPHKDTDTYTDMDRNKGFLKNGDKDTVGDKAKINKIIY